MARNVTIGGSGALFVGEDKHIDLEVLDDSDLPVDITGWAILLVVKRGVSGAVVLSKTASITGTYNAARASNTQRARFALTDDDLTIDGGAYLYSAKRTDSGSEAVLAYGMFRPEVATQV